MRERQYRRGGELLPPRHRLPDTALPLSDALLRARPACAGDDRFTDDDKTVRTAAAATCPSCPLLDPCHSAGTTATHGIWGGVDRTQSRNPKEN